MARRIPLDGRRVVLTGASSGIGAATTQRLAAGGAALALIARSEGGLEEVAARARAAGARQVVVLPADVGVREQVTAAVEAAAAELGGIDVMLVNAGASSFGTFKETSPEDFDRTFDVVFGGAVDAVRAALPHLKRAEQPRIVATVSVLSRSSVPGLGAYVAAKHGVRGFLGSLRVELAAARSPVRVSMVHPGPVDTALWRTMPSATGKEPSLPPLSYRPDAVARALVHCVSAVKPPAEYTVGLMSAISYGGSTVLGRPIAERFGGAIWRTRAKDAAGPDAPPPERAVLQAPAEETDDKRGAHRGRPSLRSALLR